MTRLFTTLLVCSALLAAYGYLMRFVGREGGSLPGLGAPIAKASARYFLAATVVFGLAALLTAIL